MRRGTVVLVLSLLVGLLAWPAAEAAPQGVKASYAAPIRDAGGRVDAVATVDRLQAMNANAYAFLVLRDTDWDDLRLRFLPEAQAAGIATWVYLVPPSECPGGTSCSAYLPYQKDYLAWARAIGTLANQYPVVTAWAIDDFNANAAFFTPSYTGQIRQAGRAVHPGLDFYPVVYANAVTAAFVSSYAPVIDSLILPFRDDPHRNTLWTGSLRAQLDQIVARLAAGNRKLILMVYAATLSNTQVTPDVEYVRYLTSVGMEYTANGKIAGVIQYALRLQPGIQQNGDRNLSHGTGSGALALTVRGNQSTAAGNYAAANTTLRLNPGSTSCRLVLWHTDDRATTGPAGHHMKQAYVGGTLVWRRDVASEGTDWYTSAPVDVAPYLTNGVGTLSLRLHQQAGVSNYPVLVRFDDITLTGCQIANPGVETAGGWTFSRSGGPVLSGQHIFDPVYSSTVHAAVARLYG